MATKREIIRGVLSASRPKSIVGSNRVPKRGPRRTPIFGGPKDGRPVVPPTKDPGFAHPIAPVGGGGPKGSRPNGPRYTPKGYPIGRSKGDKGKGKFSGGGPEQGTRAYRRANGLPVFSGKQKSAFRLRRYKKQKAEMEKIAAGMDEIKGSLT